MPRKQMPRKLTLNDDVITEILIRLPAKPFARFKCVCKRWHSLASDPYLIHLRSMRHCPFSIAGFFLCDNKDRPEYFSLHGQPPGQPDSILSFLPGSDNCISGITTINGSCNGLILCRQATPSILTEKRLLFVWNPKTMEYVEVRIPNGVRDKFFCLAFDPAKSPYFKVVSIPNPIHVYSSKTRSWKTSTTQVPFHKLGGLYQYRSVYWNGTLIWAGHNNSLLTYDVEGDSSGTLPSPQFPQSLRGRCDYLGVSRGLLHAIWRSVPLVETTAQFDIFELQPDYLSWSVLYHVDLNAIRDLYPQVIVKARISLGLRHPIRRWTSRFALSALDVVQGAEGEEDLLLLSIPGKVICYHLQKKMFKEVCNVSLPLYGPGYSVTEYPWYRFHPYSHTLSSLYI